MKITMDQAVDFQSFLMGNPPAHLGLHLARGHQPRLRGNAANAVIWYLQEVLCVLPDHFEMCHACGELYDVRSSGHLGRGEREYCDNCDGNDPDEES